MRNKTSQEGLSSVTTGAYFQMLIFCSCPKRSTRESEIIIVGIWDLNLGLDLFHSYSALKHIMFKKAYSLNFIQISQLLSNINGLSQVEIGNHHNGFNVSCKVGSSYIGYSAEEEGERIATTFFISQVYSKICFHAIL